MDLSQIAEGNEDQIPVYEANENNYHGEEIRNLPLKNLGRGPAAPHKHLFGSTCGTKRAQEEKCEERSFVNLNFKSLVSEAFATGNRINTGRSDRPGESPLILVSVTIYVSKLSINEFVNKRAVLSF